MRGCSLNATPRRSARHRCAPDGSISITASVKLRVSRGRCPFAPATAPTARSSVRDAERRFRPSASISDAVSSMPVGSATPNPATSSPSDWPGAKHAGPLSGIQPCATDASRAGEVRRRIDERVEQVRLGHDHVELLRASFRRMSASPRPSALGLRARASASRSRSTNAVPAVIGADGGDAAAPRRRAAERALDRDRVGPRAERRDHDDVGALAEVHASDAPRELEVGLDTLEGRLVRRRDEDRVDVAVARARARGQRMPRPRHGLAGERQVDVVELERVQARHAVERARRRRHQLGPDTVPGETGNSLHVIPPFAQFVAPATRAHYSCVRSACAASRGRVSEISP